MGNIPLHIQLKNTLGEKIISKKYKDKIPSERELMDEYDVSRDTIRKAVAQLVDEGLLEKRVGKGTFIVVKSIQDWNGSVRSITDGIASMGMKASAKLLDDKKVKLTPAMEKLTGKKEAYYFKRIRLADNEPLGIEENFYTLKVGEKLATYDLDEECLYELMEQFIGMKITKAKQTVRANVFKDKDCDILNIPHNTIALIIERMIVDLDGNFVEFRRGTYIADKYDLKINLSRKK